MSILKALKDLIRKMGGSTHANNIAEAIRDIPSSSGISTYYFEFDRSSSEVETDANVIEVMSKIKNKEAVIFIVKDYDSNHPEWDSVAIYQVGTITINVLDDFIDAYLAEEFILVGSVVDGEPVWQIEPQSV